MNDQIVLNGPWEFKQSGPAPARIKKWLTGSVPGTVHTDLLDCGIIEDPFYRCNELDLRWVEDAEWTYRRAFDVPAEMLSSSRSAILDFEGLDTFASIILNGRVVGRADNMFHGWQFEVHKLLRPGKNLLEVQFLSAGRVAEARAKASRIRYKSSFFEPRVFIRKAQYAGGWDWGPRCHTAGIWRPVRLLLVREARITDVCVRSGKLSTRRAGQVVEAQVEATAPRNATLRVTMSSPEGRTTEAHLPVKLRKGTQWLQVKLAVADPQLWWPAGMGSQSLYDVQVTLLDNEHVLDEHHLRTGIRHVELIRKKDKQGECFRFRINGREVFCKGANWIPSDSFLPRVTADIYRARVADARDANMNMLRVWGGGIYEAPAFYRACDELGIMVWQDFMFACAEYPEDRPLLNSIQREARETVRRLRNHPSVVLWCGNNENHWGYDAWWPPRPKRYGEVIYDKILPAACKALDPTRPFWPGSPYGGPMANDPDHGDQHEWNVWIFWQNPEKYRQSKARFVSEFGFQSVPEPATVNQFTAPEDRRLFSRVIDHHNKCEDGHARNMKFLAHLYGVPQDMEEYIYLSQVAQAGAIQTGVEHWRRRWPATAGTLFWQHNDCWPVASWSCVDYYGRPKGLWYAARRFFSPLLVSLVPAGDQAFGLADLEVWISNDTLDTSPLRLELTSWDVNGEKLSQQSVSLRPRASASWRQATISSKKIRITNPDRHFFHVGLWKGTQLLSENSHFYVQPKYVLWPSPMLSTQVEQAEDGLRVTIAARCAARAVWLRADAWEGRFSDNFFDLFPGQSRELAWQSSSGEMPHPDEFLSRLQVRSLADAGRT